MFGPLHDTRLSSPTEPPAPRSSVVESAHDVSHWQTLSTLPIAVPGQLEVARFDSQQEQEAEQRASASPDLKTSAVSDSHGPATETSRAPDSVHEALASAGTPLDATTRAHMESQFGTNFGAVRVHDNASSDRANEQIGARAFTAGRDIVFGRGQYAPGTTDGRSLLAHELAHVEQQSRAQQTLVQRAPALDGRKTTEKVDDSIATDVDKALEESPAVTKFIDKKSLRKISGKIEVEPSTVFASKYAKYAAKHSDMPDVKDVPGYTDRDRDRIVLKLNTADLEAALHEAVHFNSSTSFARQFGHHLNEGITEYFTERVLKEQKLGAGRAYRDELTYAKAFVTSVGEELVGKAYFQSDRGALKELTDALNKAGTYSKWRAVAFSGKPDDWKKAAAILKQAFGR